MNEADRADDRVIAALTTREPLLLLGLCLGAGIVCGVLKFLAMLGNESHQWAAGFLEKPIGPTSSVSPHSFSFRGAIWQWITPVCNHSEDPAFFIGIGVGSLFVLSLPVHWSMRIICLLFYIPLVFATLIPYSLWFIAVVFHGMVAGG
jgi:hypothetical protein